MGINYIHHGDRDMYEKGALMLNTLRHVIDNDSTWFALLRGLQEEFRYGTIRTGDIVRYVNEKTGADYSCIFDQYLRFPNIPELEITIETVEGKTWLSYRWISDIEDFHMPIAYSLEKDEWNFLFPTGEWQKLAVADQSTENLKIDTSRFYIGVRNAGN